MSLVSLAAETEGFCWRNAWHRHQLLGVFQLKTEDDLGRIKTYRIPCWFPLVVWSIPVSMIDVTVACPFNTECRTDRGLDKRYMGSELQHPILERCYHS